MRNHGALQLRHSCDNTWGVVSCSIHGCKFHIWNKRTSQVPTDIWAENGVAANWSLYTPRIIAGVEIGSFDVIVRHDPFSTTHDQSAPRSKKIRFSTIYINRLLGSTVSSNKADTEGDGNCIPAKGEKPKLQWATMKSCKTDSLKFRDKESCAQNLVQRRNKY